MNSTKSSNNVEKPKIWISWSTGKDSAYALHTIRQDRRYEVVGLLSTVTEDFNRVSMHSTRVALLHKQAECVGLPLHVVSIPAICNNDVYVDRMQRMIEKAEAQQVRYIVFGDLFLEDIRRYREENLSTQGIQPLFPLWQQDTRLLAEEMIAVGMKAILTCVDSKKLDPSFAGRQFDLHLLRDLPEGVDPCGERGEFHTFVYDGPMFSRRIPVSVGNVIEREGFVFADVLLQ